MKAIIWLAATCISCSAVCRSEEPKKETEPRKEESIKCNLGHLDKAWNLQFKSMTVKDTLSPKFVDGRESKQYPICEVRITLEFTKDAADVKEIRKSHVEFSILHRTPVGNRGNYMLYYLFDEDNVVLQKAYLDRVEGEITGKSGDAFRVVFSTDPATYKKIKKIEPRPFEKEK
jgi:hypothetical protein